MNQKERRKLHVTRKVIEKEIIQVEAGLAIDLASRQIKRLVRRERIKSHLRIIYLDNLGKKEEEKQKQYP